MNQIAAEAPFSSYKTTLKLQLKGEIRDVEHFSVLVELFCCCFGVQCLDKKTFIICFQFCYICLVQWFEKRHVARRLKCPLLLLLYLFGAVTELDPAARPLHCRPSQSISVSEGSVLHVHIIALFTALVVSRDATLMAMIIKPAVDFCHQEGLLESTSVWASEERRCLP